jgi:hypothetical protein
MSNLQQGGEQIAQVTDSQSYGWKRGDTHTPRGGKVRTVDQFQSESEGIPIVVSMSLLQGGSMKQVLVAREKGKRKYTHRGHTLTHRERERERERGREREGEREREREDTHTQAENENFRTRTIRSRQKGCRA